MIRLVYPIYSPRAMFRLNDLLFEKMRRNIIQGYLFGLDSSEKDHNLGMPLMKQNQLIM